MAARRTEDVQAAGGRQHGVRYPGRRELNDTSRRDRTNVDVDSLLDAAKGALAKALGRRRLVAPGVAPFNQDRARIGVETCLFTGRSPYAVWSLQRPGLGIGALPDSEW
jgi:hypothetical protein